VSVGIEGVRMGMDADVIARGGAISGRNDLGPPKRSLPPYERCKPQSEEVTVQ